MRAARFRIRSVTAAAALLAILCGLLGWHGDLATPALGAVIVAILVDISMYLRDIEAGRRHTPASQHLANALAAVRPDAEAAVNRSACIAADYLERALTAEATIDRVRQLHSQAPDDTQGPTWAGLELALARPTERPTHPFEQHPAAETVRVCRCGKWSDHHVHTGDRITCGCDTCRTNRQSTTAAEATL
ncbi:hypothetical protein GCM10020227_11650 [Streptomyces flavovirens]